MNQKWQRRLNAIFTVVAWAYFVFMAYMLLNPEPPMPKLPPPIFNQAHLVAFFALAFFVGLARARWSVWRWYPMLLCWCAGSECLQILTGRYFEWIDIANNVAGVSIGLFVAYWLRRAFFGRESKQGVGAAREAAIVVLFRPPFALATLGRVDLGALEALVIRRSSKVVAPNMLCFPGGGVEPGETPEEAARREFREEVGVDVVLGSCFAETLTPAGAPLHWFFAEAPRRDGTELEFVLQSEEVASCEWRKLADLVRDPNFLPNNLEVVAKILSGELPGA